MYHEGADSATFMFTWLQDEVCEVLVGLGGVEMRELIRQRTKQALARPDVRERMLANRPRRRRSSEVGPTRLRSELSNRSFVRLWWGPGIGRAGNTVDWE